MTRLVIRGALLDDEAEAPHNVRWILLNFTPDPRNHTPLGSVWLAAANRHLGHDGIRSNEQQSERVKRRCGSG